MHSAPFVSAFAAAALFAIAAGAAPPLPKLRADPNTITVSGISAGGFMAVQYQYAFSRSVHGAAIVAGGPYLCGSAGHTAALECMFVPSMINLPQLNQQTQQAAQSGQIDPLPYVKNQTVLMFSGTADVIVTQGCMVKLASQFQTMGVPAADTITQFSIAAEHSWVTNKYGNPCNYLGSPYVNNCNYDVAGIFFTETFTKKFNTKIVPKGTYNAANMLTFDQTTFGADSQQNSMASQGFVYVPDRCKTSRCKLHINFHGCKQGIDQIGSQYVSQTEINEWAETNGIVVLYPQVTVRTTENPNTSNPNGCFDWWGYNGPTYAFKNGVQMEIVRKMADRLLS